MSDITKSDCIQGFDVETTWESAMIVCLCGDVFQSSGKPKKVQREQRVWEAAHATCKRPERKVFWLSFCDTHKPEGSQFLGACVVDVTAEEAQDVAFDVMLRFPFAQPGSEWLAAASRKAHQLGCNPGGEMASCEIPADHPQLARYTFGVLMDRATIEQIDHVVEMFTGEPADS